MPGIDARFADWYRPATADPATAPLDARWKGVSALVTAFTAENLPTAVLLAAQQDTTEEARASLTTALKQADSTLLLKENDFELSILVGAALMQVLGTSNQLSLPLSLLLQLTDIHPWTPVIPDLVPAAHGTLRELGRRARAVQQPGMPSLEPSQELLTKRGEEIIASAAQAGQPAFGQWLATALGVISPIDEKTTARAISAVADYSNRRYQSLAEEVDILWWLLGERSIDVDRAWTEAGAGACIVIASELAALTKFSAPPERTSSFMARALASAGSPAELSIVDAVNADHLRPPVTGGVPMPATTTTFVPVLESLKGRQQSPDAQAWVPIAEHSTGVRLSQRRRAIEIADQLYAELLLRRYFEQAATKTKP